MPASPFLQLVLDVRRLMRDQQRDAAEGSVDVVEMASRLCAAGYRVTVRASIRDAQRNSSSSSLPRACVTVQLAAVCTAQQRSSQRVALGSYDTSWGTCLEPATSSHSQY
jgi:hypothetical protein